MITHALKEISESARLQRLRGKPIQAAPPLFTFNGMGVTLYGHADPDPETGSYLATLYFVILMVPIFPLARYRVIAQPGRRFQFLGKQPFRPLDRWWLGLVLGATAFLLLWLVGRSQPDNGSKDTYPGSAPADASAPASNDSAPPAWAATPPATVPGGAPNDVTASGAAPTITSAPPGPEPTGLKQRIDAGRERIEAIKSQLTSLDSQIDPLTSSMSALKSELDELDAQQQTGQPVDSSAYNEKVDQYNNFLRSRRSLAETYNELVAENNKLISEDRDMVARYNLGER